MGVSSLYCMVVVGQWAVASRAMATPGSKSVKAPTPVATPGSKSVKAPTPMANMGAKGEKDYFQPGCKLRERWLLEKRIGDGAFGQVFLAADLRDKVNVAIKTERIDVKRRCLCMEVAVMRSVAKSVNVPYMMACGRTSEFRYIVMELLGSSLFDLRNTYPRRVLPTEVMCRVGMQSLRALMDVHDAGFVHRDVKPANFCLGKHPKVAGNVFIFDFGLSRIHLIPGGGGKVRPMRKWNPGFRGTLRYASLASHRGEDLGRVDDLVPIYYMLVEMGAGQVPWKAANDRHEVMVMKEKVSAEELCRGLPKNLARMGKALEHAQYKSRPRYDKLSELLVDVLQKMGQDPRKPIVPGGR